MRDRANQRPTSQLPLWINYADCVANDELVFDVTLSSADGNATLEVWAGTADCIDATKRQNNSTSCWLVYSEAPSSTFWPVPIRAQKIVGEQTPGSAVSKTCEQGSGRQQLVLTFMFKNGDQAVSPVTFPGTLTGNTFGVDVTAPSAPTDVEVAAGENRLHLDWNGSSEGDLLGYNFYCDPPPGADAADGGVGTAAAAQLRDGSADSADGAPDSSSSGGAGGAGSGAGGAAGAAGATPTDGGTGGGDAGAGPISNCTGRSLLSQGARPNPAYKCGSVTGKTASSGVARGLQNGASYGVAIAAVDGVGNVGKLSEVKCGIPVPVTDFYEYYRELNGGGGGGFCTVSAGRAAPPAPLAIPLTVLGLLLLRRRGRQA